MRFKIFSKDDKNLEKIDVAIKEFVKVANEETKKNKQLSIVNKVFKRVTGAEIIIVYLQEKRKDYVVLTVKSSIVEQGRLNMKYKMVKQLREYLDFKGVVYDRIEGFNK